MSDGEKWAKVSNGFDRLERELELLSCRKKITPEKIVEKIRESIKAERRVVKGAFGGAFH